MLRYQRLKRTLCPHDYHACKAYKRRQARARQVLIVHPAGRKTVTNGLRAQQKPLNFCRSPSKSLSWLAPAQPALNMSCLRASTEGSCPQCWRRKGSRRTRCSPSSVAISPMRSPPDAETSHDCWPLLTRGSSHRSPPSHHWLIFLAQSALESRGHVLSALARRILPVPKPCRRGSLRVENVF